MTERIKRRSDLLSTAQAAEYLGVQAGTLDKWRWQRKGPSYLKAGRLVYYRLVELDDWIESQTVTCSI